MSSRYFRMKYIEHRKIAIQNCCSKKHKAKISREKFQELDGIELLQHLVHILDLVSSDYFISYSSDLDFFPEGYKLP